MTRTLRRSNVGQVYVLMAGDSSAHFTPLTLHGARTSLNPGDVSGDAAARFRAIASGASPLTDVDRLIGEAQSSTAAGENEFAFLQAVIAAEIANARAVRNECLRRGVSKNRFDANRKEMTYSWALNVGLALCFPEMARNSEPLITAMNDARRRRNDLMHEAAFSMTDQELHKLLIDTKAFIAALKAAELAIAQAGNG